MVSIKMTFLWRTVIIINVCGVARCSFWPAGGAVVALLRWEEASL